MLKNLLGGLTGLRKKNEEVAQDDAAIPVEQAVSGDEAELASAAHGPVDLPHTLGFVSHQPILDRQNRVVAYEFVVRDSKAEPASVSKRLESDRVLLSTLQNMEVFRLLEYRRAFVHVSIAALEQTMLEELPAHSVIYILEPVAGFPITDDTLVRLQEMKAKGWRFALDPAQYDKEALAERLQPALFGAVDFMVVDFGAPANDVLAPFLDQLPKRFPQARWLARNVGTAEDWDVCLHAPGSNRFALFQGSYLASGKTGTTTKVDASQVRVLEIMRLLRANAGSSEIEAQFKLDSLLLFKLLRFVNSPVNGLARKVQSIEETLMLIGRESLLKWLSLLLFTTRKEDGRTFTLLEKSLIRARFLEKLGSYRGNKLEAEHLFLTGMFSLLAALLNAPLADALAPLDLPPPVRDALLVQKGIFAPYFALAVACEQGNNDKIAALTKQLNFELDLVNRYYMDAVVWAQEVLRDNDAQSNIEAV
jgi:EAL and modified HD-GYP domain-containing signal transduction protein